MTITEYTTESGSVYWVDEGLKLVANVAEDTEWRKCVFIIADGRLVFVESIIPGADPPLYHLTTTSKIVKVRHGIEYQE